MKCTMFSSLKYVKWAKVSIGWEVNQQHVASKKAKMINILFTFHSCSWRSAHHICAWFIHSKEDGRATKKAATPPSANVVCGCHVSMLWQVPARYQRTRIYVWEEDDDDDIAWIWCVSLVKEVRIWSASIKRGADRVARSTGRKGLQARWTKWWRWWCNYMVDAWVLNKLESSYGDG